ncbi:copper chaperone PCu(A)C [Nocardioides sp. J2M5]|uniref:copper chaperone PCu(A)C n=1 Tax=Nocardioides palaemonis TaxID=2829810 RepID=UPI001BAA2E36|nr:copper chaperone PCu(A)C [Nocardioides palaemonis]MBS2936775.1 copper chaperone PCu(A)C [Nocardioides palaemonis]
MRTTRFAALLSAAALTLVVSGCGSDDPTTTASDSSSGSDTSASETTEASSLSVTDPWVKSAEEGMTAAFGTLVNEGDSDITVVSATASDITGMMELHETVQNDDGSMAMQPKEGGFVIPAGGEHELSPGGDHLMIMDLTRPVEPGETVTLTLTLDDGSTTDVEATVKEFTGADENYQDGEGMDMDSDEGMDMGSEDSGDN